MTEKSKYSDSAGVPWSGRTIQQNIYHQDTGEADPNLLEALLAFKTNPTNQSEILERFSSARVLVPLVAFLQEAEDGSHGLKVDKSAELSIVSVMGPDGQRALPIFSSVASMARWNQNARPVPNNGRTVALAAVAEGNTRVVIDPGSETEFVLRRPALEAAAQGISWVHPEENPEVIAIADASLTSFSEVVSFTLRNGDPAGTLSNHELLVVIYLVDGLTKDRVREIEMQFLNSISSNRRFVELVDSVGVKFLNSSSLAR